ncbi:MAG TPA: cytochrome c biogenesis protein CcsA [Gemmatimonadaceae bacterium]|jgi:ABC-type transport system involved in cytochrome c biogenesis, permease component
MSDSTLTSGARSGTTAGARAPARGMDWLFAAAVVLVAATFVRVIYFTPIEMVQGPAQKIFYLHLPAALAAFLAFGIVAFTSILYLWLKEPKLDLVAESAAEVGVVFTTMVLISGPLWGKPVWGTWWTWDARLTLTLFLWFIYVGYLVLRGAIEEPGMRARYSAVLGILGALLIPFIHLSVYLFRTLHPMPIVIKPSSPSLPKEMLETLLFAFVSFMVLFFAFFRARYRLAVEQAALEKEDRR